MARNFAAGTRSFHHPRFRVRRDSVSDAFTSADTHGDANSVARRDAERFTAADAGNIAFAPAICCAQPIDNPDGYAQGDHSTAPNTGPGIDAGLSRSCPQPGASFGNASGAKASIGIESAVGFVPAGVDAER
jgi:hypothetical protein